MLAIDQGVKYTLEKLNEKHEGFEQHLADHFSYSVAKYWLTDDWGPVDYFYIGWVTDPSGDQSGTAQFDTEKQAYRSAQRLVDEKRNLMRDGVLT